MIHLLQYDQHNYSNVFTRTYYGMTVIVTKAVNVRTIWTNKMHYFLLVYFNNKDLHVSSRFAAHHQQDQLRINSM